MLDKPCEPSTRSLTETVEGARQEADVVRSGRIFKAGGLLAEHLFLQVAV